MTGILETLLGLMGINLFFKVTMKRKNCLQYKLV